MKNIELKEVQQIKVVRVNGKLTFDHGADKLRKTLQELAQTKGCRVLLNLANVKFMDSIGLEALLVGYHSVTRADGEIKFSNLSPKNYHLLEITSLLDVFDIHQTEEEASVAFDEEYRAVERVAISHLVLSLLQLVSDER